MAYTNTSDVFKTSDVFCIINAIALLFLPWGF